MASTQTIKIKRSTGSSAPSTLASGELAYSKGTDTFYIGDPAAANTPIAIGGAIKNNAGTPVLSTGVTAAEIRALIDTEGGVDFLVYDANLQSFVTTFTLPTSDGSADQVLKTDGSGTLSFANAATGGLSNVVEDTTPQLGGMLDVNGNSLGDGTLELLSFTETASAVNEFTIANAATGNGPTLSATGGDSNIDINIVTKGTGVVKVDNLSIDGNTVTTTSGNLTLDSAGGTVAVADNMTVSGNLTVSGTTTTLSTTNSVISDLLIELGNGTTGTPSNDAGLVIERGDSDNAFIGFDESADKFIVGTGSFTGASTGNLTITTGTLVANLEGNVTGNVTGNADGLTPGSVSEAAIAVASDYMFFFDGGASGSSAKESVADFVAAVAGTNISASSGVMSVATATASTIGLASFDSTQFDVSSGAVTLAEIDGGTY